MAEDRVQLGQLTQALAIENNALFPYSQEVSGTQTTFGAPMSQIATKVAEGTTFSTLATTSKNLVGAINELQAGGGGGGQYTETTLYNTYTAFSTGSDITLSDDADNYDEIQIYFCYNETGDGNYYTHRRVERVSKSTVLWSISERQQTGNDRGILDMIGSFQDSGIYGSWRVYFTNKTTLHCVGKTDRTWNASQLGIEKIVGVTY